MDSEDKILAMLEKMDARLDRLEQGQAATNARIDTMQEYIEQIKEDTAITRETVNGLGEWTEMASVALKIQYPVPTRE